MLKVEEDGIHRTSKKRYYIVVVLVALFAVILGILIGYFIGREVKGKEIENERAKDSSSKLTAEEKIALHKEAVEQVSRTQLKENLRYFTSVPHVPGSKETYDQAVYVKQQWKDYGFDTVEFKKYQVLLSFPVKPGVITVKYDNGTEEYRTSTHVTFLDPSENDTRVLPPFNAFSPAGSVKGKLVYANYGKVSDFKTLRKNNISCVGKIILMRYGGTSRVYKHGRAFKAGAKGLILYMDPKDYAKQGMDKVYPDYNWLPNTAVQRGTLKYSSTRGDALTPGYPAVDGIYRLPMEEAKKGLPQIPVHPISYKDAEPLLRMLKGSVNVSSWQGGLPFTYGVEMEANDTREVTLNVSTALQLKDVYNVIGTIKGTTEPDRLVLLGNHRDAWVFGAADPSSGTAALMETSRVIGQLLKKGWRPRRSLVFCSWGAEEPQLMGSAEWQEDYAKILHRRAIAYLNVDMSVDGKYSFRAKSMPLVDWALFEATKEVPSPYGNESVFDEWRRKLPASSKAILPKPQEIRSGSDYVVFYQRLGIPCLDIRYTYDRKTSGNPLYHTVHDNFRWMSTLIDPEFKFHQVTTRVWLQLAFAFSDFVILPFNATHYGVKLAYYSKSFGKKYGKNLTANDVTLDHLNAAIANYSRAAEIFQKEIDKTDLNDALAVSRLNERLVLLERSFVDHSPIIPEKPLQRHVIVTPSFHVRSSWFGGVAEALYRVEQGKADWEEVKKQISNVVYGIRSATSVLDMAPI